MRSTRLYCPITAKEVRKCGPLKRITQTDAIFDCLHQLNAEADDNPGLLRISLDTKAAVKIGPFSRGGTSRAPRPYHSKYNPVERLWGLLENHWRGELLSSVEKTLGLARTMTYKGHRPMVRKINKMYQSGVSLTKRAMASIERSLKREKGLESWVITISPVPDLG